MFNGTMMLAEGYLDQPYCGTLPSGRWICTITGNSRPEGSPGEHVMALWSDDYGASWSDTVSVEPAPVNIELANAYSTGLDVFFLRTEILDPAVDLKHS